MAPRFGTSGLRGLAADLTDDLVAAHVRAFLAVCDTGGAICLGQDLRDSSPRLARAAAEAALAAGIEVSDCGTLPTPALALEAQVRRCGALMVTGSHIPADRNGLKFYDTSGEITKAQEGAILSAVADGTTPSPKATGARQPCDATARYAGRYRTAFPADALRGARIGVWSQSGAARDILPDLLTSLGAEAIPFDRSAGFVAVDTEALSPDTRAMLRARAEALHLDAIVSTDGDADRPLLADTTGAQVPGDILGQITARFLGAETVVTPVTAGRGAELSGAFGRVIRTRIGSPFVIAAMEAAPGRTLGYEPNGGVLLGFDAELPGGTLPALMTRDSLLPILATLCDARDGNRIDVAARVAAEPPRFATRDRIGGVAPEDGAAFVTRLSDDREQRRALLESVGMTAERSTDRTDGLLIQDASDRLLHLRPSGNAPEFRVTVETGDAAISAAIHAKAMAAVARLLD